MPAHSPLLTAGPILVPTDFSEHSSAALAFALDLAGQLKRKVIVLHVVHDPASAPGYYQREGADGVKTMDDVAAEMMERFLAKTAEKYPQLDMQLAETKLVGGIPSRRIVEVANMIDASMVIMGSHGHRGLKSLVVASKAKKVVQNAPMPVMVVKAQAISELAEDKLDAAPNEEPATE